MILFADASAIVAIVADEAESDQLEEQMAGATDKLYSAMVEWEAVSALCRTYKVEVMIARARVRSFFGTFDFRMVEIGESVGEAALDAYQTYGKGRHPAGLNMGDCFAYACAKANGARLLYKGADFAQTDLA